jgi:hypothetical protein
MSHPYVAGQLNSRSRKIRPIVAVDIGFAQSSNPSTGVAWASPGSEGSQNFTFAAAIERVADLIQDSSETVLIVEAPLSCRFDDEGNPMGRFEFERQTGRSPAFWYLRSGAQVCLAAAFFLERLVKLLPRESKRRIRLIEGFASFKDSSKPKPKHHQEAAALIEAFLDPATVDLLDHKAAGSAISVSSLRGLGAIDEIPPVIGLNPT